jgi:hypothetical protein
MMSVIHTRPLRVFPERVARQLNEIAIPTVALPEPRESSFCEEQLGVSRLWLQRDHPLPKACRVKQTKQSLKHTFDIEPKE